MSGLRLIQHKAIIRRAIALSYDRSAFVATWVDVEREDEEGGKVKRSTMPALLIRYTGGAVRLIEGGAAEAFDRPATTVAMPDGIAVDLARTPPPTSADDMLMGVQTVADLLDDARPDIARLVTDLTATFRRFVAFPAGADASAEDYATLCAAYVASTYLLPAFPAVGYLWLTGLPGSGKSTVAQVIARAACLPLMASSSGTLASLRGHADAGGTLILDNYESVTGKDDVARNLRSFCELGYQQGAVATLQVPSGKGRGWETARCNVFCNRTFTAVAEPPDALASRCITILMFRTSDSSKADLSPQDTDNWQVAPHDLVQRCWMVALHCLGDAAEIVRTITGADTGLTNRDLQVWRPVLTVARLADAANGDTAVWDALLRLARHLLVQRAEDDGSREATLTRALAAITEDGNRTATTGMTLNMVKKQYAEAHGIAGDEKEDMPWGLENVKKVGTVFKKMGVPKLPRTSAGNVYDIAEPVIARLRALYLPPITDLSNTSAPSAQTAPSTSHADDEPCADRAECAESVDPAEGVAPDVGWIADVWGDEKAAGDD